VTNGLLLRADIHTLFDLRLVLIKADGVTVEIDEALIDSDYTRFNGIRLALPDDPRMHPDRAALARHRVATD
jgi:hypothetical protein